VKTKRPRDTLPAVLTSDFVPDSLSPSDHGSEFSHMEDHKNLSSSSKRILPALPNDSEYRKISKIATSMMRLQVAEDDLLKEIQTILAVSPETAPQLEKYISPNIRAQLNSGLHSFGMSLIYKYFCVQLMVGFNSSRGIRQSG
jgi:hypothetical protein